MHNNVLPIIKMRSQIATYAFFLVNIQAMSTISFPNFKGYVFKNSLTCIPTVIHYHKELIKQSKSTYKCLSLVRSKTDVITKQRLVKSHQAAFPLSKPSSDEWNPFYMWKLERDEDESRGFTLCKQSDTVILYWEKIIIIPKKPLRVEVCRQMCESLIVNLVLCAT